MSSKLSIILLVASALVVGVTANGESPSLEALCANKQVKFDTIKQVKDLIDQLKAEGGCDKYHDSLLDLEELLGLVQAGTTSSLQFTTKLEKYHKKYIASDNNKANENIPISLREFFISMAFQISAEYKMLVVNNLEVDSKKYVAEDDYSTIKQLDSTGAILVDKDADISDFDDIVLLNDLARVAEGDSPEGGSIKLMIKVKTSEVLRRLIQTCRNKFSPIYEKLILPLISLSNMGYNYRGTMLERELKELKTNPLVRQWYNIVQVCETFKAIEIFDAKGPVMDGDKQIFTFVSPEEGERLRESQGSVNSAASAETPIEYVPEAFHRDDLWIKDQNELAHLLKNYKSSSSEVDRIKGLVIRRLMVRLKDSIKSGKILLHASQFVKEAFKKDEAQEETSLSEDLIEMVDDAIEESEETAMVNKLDGSVAGGKKLKKVPNRTGKIRKVEDRTKLLSKAKRFTYKSLLPSKFTMVWWIVCIGAVLLIAGLCILAASAG